MVSMASICPQFPGLRDQLEYVSNFKVCLAFAMRVDC
jgi:hypothetical protein